MNEASQAHWDHSICEATLDALAYSCIKIPVAKGMNRQAARHFALLEAQKRQELARTVGADAALLAHLEWQDIGKDGIVCTLVLDEMPEDAGERFLLAFDLPSQTGVGA
jgi:hypothetical protein